MDWSTRRIRAAAALNNARHYLEVGVHHGRTFLNVDIEFKDGVDPDFALDVDPHASEKVRFFRQPSDQFWVSRHPRVYDVIFLDGLHTFEQTMRDLLCSMRFSHGQTIWLIDDTLPCDVFSAIPDKERSLYERRRMKLPGLPWHGDVFKVVFAMHDLIPVLKYATITGSGNPQTVAWYSPRTAFRPHAENWEAISRMTYFDIQPHLEVFNVMDEDHAFTLIRSDVLEARERSREKILAHE